MKFHCSKKDLSEVINNILPAVSSKSTLSALEGILIERRGKQLKATAYNLEQGMIKTLDLSENDGEDGSIVLNASLLANILNKMPDGVITFSSDEKLLTNISCMEVDFTILGLSSEEFPDMPSLTDEKSFTIPHHLLRSMISQTLFSISQTDQNPVLTGSLFDIKDSVLRIVSVDGVRLAMRRERVKLEEEVSFIVPGKTLSEIAKLLTRLATENDDEEEVTISVSTKHISFAINGYHILSRLLEGSFLDFENAIPKERLTEVTVDTRAFLNSINRASIIINERAKSPIRCTIENGNIRLFCETSIGKINDVVPAKIEGEDVKIGFNNKFMADALKASECDSLRMLINGPISPIVLLPPDTDDFLFLVLPVRLKV